MQAALPPKGGIWSRPTTLTSYFEKVQVIKMHLVKHSPDPHVSALYDMRCKREEAHEKTWRPTRLLEKVCSMTDFDLKFQHSVSVP